VCDRGTGRQTSRRNASRGLRLVTNAGRHNIRSFLVSRQTERIGWSCFLNPPRQSMLPFFSRLCISPYTVYFYGWQPWRSRRPVKYFLSTAHRCMTWCGGSVDVNSLVSEPRIARCRRHSQDFR